MPTQIKKEALVLYRQLVSIESTRAAAFGKACALIQRHTNMPLPTACMLLSDWLNGDAGESELEEPPNEQAGQHDAQDEQKQA